MTIKEMAKKHFIEQSDKLDVFIKYAEYLIENDSCNGLGCTTHRYWCPFSITDYGNPTSHIVNKGFEAQVYLTELKRLIKENKMFTKEDLKPFMRVRIVSGEIGIVCVDKCGKMFYTGEKSGQNGIRDEILTGDEWYCIKEVYDAPKSKGRYLDESEFGKLLWQRKDNTELKDELKKLEKENDKISERISEIRKEL